MYKLKLKKKVHYSIKAFFRVVFNFGRNLARLDIWTYWTQFKLQQATEVGTGLPEVKYEGYFAGSVSPNIKQSQISAKMKSKHVDFLVVLV